MWAQYSAEDGRIEMFATESTSFQRLVAWFDAHTNQVQGEWTSDGR